MAPTSTVMVISTVTVIVVVSIVALAPLSSVVLNGLVPALPPIPLEVTMLPPLVPLVFGPLPPPLVEPVVGVRKLMAMVPLDRWLAMASPHLEFLAMLLSVTGAARVAPMCMLESGAEELDVVMAPLPPLPSLQSSIVLLPKLLMLVANPLLVVEIPIALPLDSVPRDLAEAVSFRVLVTAQKPLARLARLTMCRVLGLEVVTCSRALARLTLLLPQLLLVL